MSGFSSETDRWGNRTYFLDGDPTPYPSVTTILSKGEPKTGIDFQKRKIAAECAVDDFYRVIAPLLRNGGRDIAIDYIMDAASRQWSKSTSLGTTIHAVAEAIGNDWPLPDYVGMLADPIIATLDPHNPDEETAEAVRARISAEVEPRIAALRMFFDDWKPVMTHTEFTVFNTRLKYAGTCDGVFEITIDGKKARCMFDWKTTKAGRQGHGIYASTGCQLAAYRHSDLMVDNNGTRQPVPEVDVVYGINILSGKYAVVPINCTPPVPGADAKCPSFNNFRWVQAVAKYVKEGQNQLIGAPVAPPIRMENVS